MVASSMRMGSQFVVVIKPQAENKLDEGIFCTGGWKMTHIVEILSNSSFTQIKENWN